MPKKLAIYLPDLSGGGVERMRLALIPYFQNAGYQIDLVLQQKQGALVPQIPGGVTVIDLASSSTLRSFPKLWGYWHRKKPDVFLSALGHNNLLACFIKSVSQTKTRLIVSQHNAMSAEVERGSWKYKLLPLLSKYLLPCADSIIAVSNGVADDLANCCSIARHRISTIYNPVIDNGFDDRAQKEVNHPWFNQNETSVILAAGRLTPQKDFATLIRAFSILRRTMTAKLLILGEGEQRSELEFLITELGLGQDIQLIGYCQNPLPYMRQASLFVLSSRYEGFGNVLVEALACGTPVISTDCPHGPAEICSGLPYDALCEVGQPEKLAKLMIRTLNSKLAPDALKEYTKPYMAECSAQHYLSVFRDR